MLRLLLDSWAALFFFFLFLLVPWAVLGRERPTGEVIYPDFEFFFYTSLDDMI